MKSKQKTTPPARLRLGDVRAVFRLIGEVRELGADPQRWRPHMVRRLRKLMGAHVVVSSEVHFRTCPDSGGLRVVDVGWGCDDDRRLWQIQTEQRQEPEDYWLSACPLPPAAPDESHDPRGRLVAVKPTRHAYGGTSFIFSQCPLPHIGAVDQLGLHRTFEDEPFTPVQHRLVRLLHVELGRLWHRDALRHARDPAAHLPPRLAQTLHELLVGGSEKEIAVHLHLSRHTVHNYIKALHRRFGVSSRGELLARAARPDFIPRLSLE